MNIKEMIGWQWIDYSKNHQDKGNLIIHIIAIPLMWAGLIFIILSVVRLSFWGTLIGFGGMLLSLLLQNLGHGERQISQLLSRI